MKIEIIGTLGYMPWKSRLAKKFTSGRLFFDNKIIQIDSGNKFELPSPNVILISHTHYDHVDELRTVPAGIEVIVPNRNFLERIVKKNPALNYKVIGKSFKIGSILIEPFFVLHSATTETYGYKFTIGSKKIVWLSDYCIIPKLEILFNDLDYLFLGAAALKKPISHKGFGHCQGAVYQVLRKISKLEKPPKKIYLIHFGIGMSPIIKKTKYLQNEFPNLSIDYTWDSKVVKL